MCCLNRWNQVSYIYIYISTGVPKLAYSEVVLLQATIIINREEESEGKCTCGHGVKLL